MQISVYFWNTTIPLDPSALLFQISCWRLSTGQATCQWHSSQLRSCACKYFIETLPGLPGWFVRYNLRHVSWFLWYKNQLTTAQDQPTINCQPSVLPAALLWVDSSSRIQWDLLLGDIWDLASDLRHNYKTAQLVWELLRGLLASLNSNSHAVLIFDIS